MPEGLATDFTERPITDTPSTKDTAPRNERRWRRLPLPALPLSRRRALALILLLLLLPAAFVAGRRCWALRELRIARSLMDRYHQDDAHPHLEACLRYWPDNAEAQLLLARAARRANVLDRAEKYLDQFEQAHGPTEELALERILQAAASGEIDKVRKYCEELVEQNSPATSLILEALAQGCFRLYRLRDGDAVLHAWFEREPDNTQALLFQAGLWTLLLHHSKAIATYERLLELDPDHHTGRFRLALVMMEDRLYEAAAPHLELLRVRQPDNLAVNVQLARCRDFLGDQQEAERLLEEVLAREPHFSHALSERGRLALRQGQAVRAEECLREAFAQEPGNHELLYQLILALEHNGKEEEAAAGSQRLEQLKNDLKRLEMMVIHDMQARPNDPVLHCEFAQIQLRLGHEEEAIPWLHRVLHEQPSHVAARWILAEYYEKTGDEKEAAYHRRFLKTKPVVPNISKK
jgi:predicted Zn-dependent protease